MSPILCRIFKQIKYANPSTSWKSISNVHESKLQQSDLLINDIHISHMCLINAYKQQYINYTKYFIKNHDLDVDILDACQRIKGENDTTFFTPLQKWIAKNNVTIDGLINAHINICLEMNVWPFCFIQQVFSFVAPYDNWVSVYADYHNILNTPIITFLKTYKNTK